MYGHMANYTTKVIQKTRPRPLIHRPHKALSELRAWNKATWLQYIRTILSQDIPQSYHLWTPCLHQELAYTPKNPHRRANMTKWIWEKNIIIFIELSIKPFQNPPLWHLFVLLKYLLCCYCNRLLDTLNYNIYYFCLIMNRFNMQQKKPINLFLKKVSRVIREGTKQP